MAAQGASQLTLSLVAGGFASFGVLAKIGYDAVVARRVRRRDDLSWLLTERRQAYDAFLSALQVQRDYQSRLQSLTARALKGDTAWTQEEQDAFPKSGMVELVATMQAVRRLGRNFDAIRAAESIVQIVGDRAAALSLSLSPGGPTEQARITLFVLDRLLEERVREFEFGYREDLGLGPPSGAPKGWPADTNRLSARSGPPVEAIVRRSIDHQRRVAQSSDPQSSPKST